MPRIEAIYAFIATEADGDEGVCAVRGPDMVWQPLVGADRARIESHRAAAREIALTSGCPVRLVKFSNRVSLGDA